MVSDPDDRGFRGGNLWGRCHRLWMRATDSGPISHVTQSAYAAREEAHLLEAGQGDPKMLIKHLDRLQMSVETMRAYLLAIAAGAEELRRDLEVSAPQTSASQVWADAYRNVVANRPRRPE